MRRQSRYRMEDSDAEAVEESDDEPEDGGVLIAAVA